jgi:Glycosyl hydrolases family 25
MIKGIDVASYQSASFGTTGLSFVLIKATEGTDYTNPRYAAQVAHARSQGLIVGHYHFHRPGSVSAQADFFLKNADVRPGEMIADDWEDTGVTSANKDAWLAYVEAKRPHNRVLLYCNRDFWLNRDKSSNAGDGLWIADPSAPAGQPRVKSAWTLHQYGISGTDLDLGNFKDKAAMAVWTVKNPAPKPKPTPTPAPKPTPTPGGNVTAPQIVDIPPTGDIGTTDPKTSSGRQEFRLGYFVAHLTDEARKTNALLVQLIDAVKGDQPAPAQTQTEHAAALTEED